jgi:predicted kinase
MFHAMRFSGMPECERAVTEAQYPVIRALLTAGFDVVSDDTWLNEEQFQVLTTLADNVGADVEVWDMRDVLPDVCIERDAARGALVGSEAIIDMYRRYIHE